MFKSRIKFTNILSMFAFYDMCFKKSILQLRLEPKVKIVLTVQHWNDVIVRPTKIVNNLLILVGLTRHHAKCLFPIDAYVTRLMPNLTKKSVTVSILRLLKLEKKNFGMQDFSNAWSRLRIFKTLKARLLKVLYGLKDTRWRSNRSPLAFRISNSLELSIKLSNE